MECTLYKRKPFTVIIFVLIAMLCVSCSSAPVTRKEMDRYVAKTYGTGIFLKEEKTADATTYYYEDKKCGFQYWVKSFSSGFNVDNSTFFKYEDKNSNFEEQYYVYITEQLEADIMELEQKYNVDIEKTEIKTEGCSVKDLGLANIILPADKKKLAPELSGIVARLYQKKDSRNFWKEGYVNIYTDDNECLGYYDIGREGYLTSDEKDIERFEILAEQKDKSSVYEYSQTVSMEEFLELTGLSLDDVQEKDQEEVIMRFFRTKKGKKFFIADVIYQGDLYSDF